MKKANPYDQRFAGEEYYTGKKPSAICVRVLEIIQPSAGFNSKLIDLGCGEGRNAVFFAREGFQVVGLDASPAGLEKTKRFAEEVGVNIETVEADIITYKPDDTYEVVFSTGTLQYLPTDLRRQWFKRYKAATAAEGIHVMSVFVKKPFITKAPDSETSAYPYKCGELLGYYWDWEILYCTEEIFDCTSSGAPHKHAVNRVIARRYKG